MFSRGNNQKESNLLIDKLTADMNRIIYVTTCEKKSLLGKTT